MTKKKEPNRTHSLASTGLINKNDGLPKKLRSSVSGSADGSQDKVRNAHVMSGWCRQVLLSGYHGWELLRERFINGSLDLQNATCAPSKCGESPNDASRPYHPVDHPVDLDPN
jgi:hypothetical protein